MKLVQEFDLCEIRLDLCNFNNDEIASLFMSHKNLLATFRPGVVTEEERKAALKKAIESGAAYIDIEIENDDAFKTEMIQFAKQHHCASIISYHNYDNTPNSKMLETIIDEGFASGADVVKIAALSNSEQDNANLMSVYRTKRRMIVFGMGEKGIITRIAAPLLGAEFTFAAPDEKNATAPGQISIEKLREIYRLIK